MFPVMPVPDNNVIKPSMNVFKDMDDYRRRGKNVDREYAEYMASKKSGGTRKSAAKKSTYIKHKMFGLGIITRERDGMLYITFEKNVKKTLVVYSRI